MNSQELESNLQNLDLRLSKIEKLLNIKKPLEAPTASSSTATLSPATDNKPEKKPGNWLGTVGIICLILAAGFIVKLSIDSGWLTPARQMGLAALLGTLLIATGFFLMKYDRAYASLLPAAGIVIFYLTTFAAHQYYSLISFTTAIAITSIVSGWCLYLYRIIHHDLYAITAAAGAYLSPVVLALNADTVFSLYYFLICSLVFATLSIWVKSRTLAIVAAYLAILVNSYVGFNLQNDALIAIILPLHFLIFSIGSYLYTVHTKNELTEKEAWSFFPVLTLFYAMEYYFIDRIQPGLAPWISLAFAALLIGIYLIARKIFPEKNFKSQAVILAFTTLVAFHSLYLEILPLQLRPWLFVAIVILISLAPNKDYSKKSNKGYLVPILAILSVIIIEYVSMLWHLIDSYNFSWLMVALASVVSLWILFITKKDILVKDEYQYGLLGAAHLLAITAFYQLTSNSGSLAVSASWLLYASAVIIFAFIRKDKIMAKSALVVLGFAAGKALLYDFSSAPTIIRILCLLLTGAVLYGSGFLMRKISAWEK